MIEQYFLALGPWSWIILGILLLVFEIIAPGTMFLWFGVAALLVGIISFLVDLGWQNAFILFALLSLVSVIAGRFVMRHIATSASDKPLLNERAQALVGNVYELDTPIRNGQGRVKIFDTYWRIKGPDCDAGSMVRIVGGAGATLEIEPVENSQA